MRLNFCVACGTHDSEALEHHHLVPRSAGGIDSDTNMITLCHACHGKAHGYERANVRELTRQGLARAKARGVKLGGDKGRLAEVRARGTVAGVAVRQQRAASRAADIAPMIAELQAEGATSLGQLAAALTERGIPTSRGADRWSPMQVSRVLKAVTDGA